MALTVDQIIAKFSHKVFPVIKVETNYQSIHNIWTLLYGNDSTLTTKLGGGNRGHIRIDMQDMSYTIILPTPYNVDVDPGGTATIPTQASTTVHSQPRDKHAEASLIHDNHHNMDAVLKLWY